MSSRQWIMESPIGKLHLVASATGLEGILWQRSSASLVTSLSGREPEVRMLARAVRELEEYFSGRRREFEVPLDPQGTEFQRRVWAELRRIPYGRTCSYAELAKRIRHPKAVRAVGTANGRNPISIMIPCHRVIASNGTLGGYAGGLNTKTELLKLEDPASTFSANEKSPTQSPRKPRSKRPKP